MTPGASAAHVNVRVGCIASAVLLVVCASASSTPGAQRGLGTPASSRVVRAVVERTNAARTGAGLAALRENDRLARAARIHADQLARAGRLAHELKGVRYPTLLNRLDAVDYEWRAVGENIAYGQQDAAAVVADWMGSRGHRANILNPSFTELGVSLVLASDGRPYYVQVFARPR